MYAKGWRQIGVQPNYVSGIEKIKVDEELSVLMKDIKDKMRTPLSNPSKRAQHRAIMAEKQKLAQRQISINAFRGGRMHNKYANKGVS